VAPVPLMSADAKLRRLRDWVLARHAHVGVRAQPLSAAVLAEVDRLLAEPASPVDLLPAFLDWAQAMGLDVTLRSAFPATIRDGFPRLPATTPP